MPKNKTLHKQKAARQRLDAELIIAVSRKDVAVGRKLLSRGANPNARSAPNPEGVGALILAIRRGSVELARALMEAGADVEDVFENRSALDWAAIQSQTEIASALLAHGARVEAAPGFWSAPAPLHCAIVSRSMGVARVLLAAGADAHAENQWGQTPLELGVANGDSSSLALLLEFGADPLKKSSGQIAAFDCAKPGTPARALFISWLEKRELERGLAPAEGGVARSRSLRC